mmetsp:Transcript_10585/g.25089  ORF Transcript_10585/g.25089 Transcript_10585/m.25089 type:complete len:251 (-) Transcript_10585:59-811(-)
MVGARVRPHSTGVGPGVPDIGPLMVLDCGHVDEVGAVAEGHERKLLPDALLLDHDLLALIEHLLRKRNPLCHARQVQSRNLDSLASHKTVSLNHVLSPELLGDVLLHALRGGKCLVHRQPCDVVIHHDVARETLAGLHLSHLLGRSDRSYTRRLQRIHNTSCKRSFRPDDGHVSLEGFAEGHNSLRVVELPDFVRCRELGDSRVLGRTEAQHSGAFRRAADRSGQGNLAGAASNNTDAHLGWLRIRLFKR